MGSSDTEASEKTPRASNSAQDQPPTTSSVPAAPVYADWSSFQAYSPIPPHGFFPSPMVSGSPAHPYMWGPQPIMPPYGTPPPPYVMYPHGGVYAHPSITPGSHPFSPYAIPSPISNAEAFGATGGGGGEGDGKSSEGRDKNPMKNSKGSLNMIIGKKDGDPTKIYGASADGGYSHSGESGSEDSSEGSDVNSQNEPSGGQGFYDAEAHQNGNPPSGSRNGITHIQSQSGTIQTAPLMPIPAQGVPDGIVGPATNLNIGMEYWSTASPSPIPLIQAKVPATAAGGAMTPSGPSEPRLQDERELKRQRRKQSNRESARRSRLRKQAECEELAQRVEVLKEENVSLIAERNRIRNDYEQLLSQNTSLKEKLGEIPRGAVDSKIDINGQNNTAEGGH